MAISRKWLAPVIALTCLLLSSGTVATPVSSAEEAVLIPGATIFKRLDPLYPLIRKSYRFIGINFHDDVDPQIVDYSQNPFATERALAAGVMQAEIAVREIDGEVVVIGESMGSMVASRLAAKLAASSDPPSPNDIRFVLIASPEEGIAQYFKVGTYIPLLNYRVSRVAESPYPTAVVIGEYDFWADPPDRPWNLVALANAALGVVFVHGPPTWPVDPVDVPPENVTVDGTVTTYLVPTEHLPLTQPLRLLGIPDRVVDAADRILRPIVDAGYRRQDKPGDMRPYLADGRIRRDAHAAQSRSDQQGEDPGVQKAERRDRPRRSGIDVRESRSDRAERWAQRQTGSGGSARVPRAAGGRTRVATVTPGRPPRSGHHRDGVGD
ncbi:PE-PPE domain-containing protein [Mycolicibacterium chubuense NBB4]|uniref:PE-PPE domain-containing protein n=1 Tax=Mycolicibacterium chubuense (strain NBB4) TaxID=710421 RepID=I4BDJ7_MYCCN|nr:PE-PPE domain-containing protein [Mycolicibacterium chubuense NBB4]